MKNIINELAEIFKALGDPNRLKLVSYLAFGTDLCVGMLANKVGMSQPAVSQHLKVLKNVGLVEANKIGYHVHYRLNRNVLDRFGIKIEKFIDVLSDDCELKSKCCEEGSSSVKCEIDSI